MDKVVFVEFNDDGRPFSLCVRHGSAMDFYDIELDRKGNVWAHNSGTDYRQGAGQRACLGHDDHHFWAEPDVLVTVYRWPGDTYVSAPESQRVELPAEYAEPLWTWATEGRCEWCTVCEEMVPIEDWCCEHIWWCDECGEWSTPDERCDCEQTDEQR